MGHAFKNNQIEREYGIKAKCATNENLQENQFYKEFIRS